MRETALGPPARRDGRAIARVGRMTVPDPLLPADHDIVEIALRESADGARAVDERRPRAWRRSTCCCSSRPRRALRACSGTTSRARATAAAGHAAPRGRAACRSTRAEPVHQPLAPRVIDLDADRARGTRRPRRARCASPSAAKQQSRIATAIPCRVAAGRWNVPSTTARMWAASSANDSHGTLAASASGIRNGAGIHCGENAGTPASPASIAVVQLRWMTAHALKIAAWIDSDWFTMTLRRPRRRRGYGAGILERMRPDHDLEAGELIGERAWRSARSRGSRRPRRRRRAAAPPSSSRAPSGASPRTCPPS